MGDRIHLQDWWLSLLQNRSSVPGSPSAPQAPVTASRDGGCAVIPDYLSQASSTRLPWGERLKTHVHPLQPIRDSSQSNEETLKRITSVRCITLYMMRLCSRGNCRLCILLVFWHTRCTSQNYTKACFLRRKEVLRNQKTIYFLFLKLIKIEGIWKLKSEYSRVKYFFKVKSSRQKVLKCIFWIHFKWQMNKYKTSELNSLSYYFSLRCNFVLVH